MNQLIVKLKIENKSLKQKKYADILKLNKLKLRNDIMVPAAEFVHCITVQRVTDDQHRFATEMRHELCI